MTAILADQVPERTLTDAAWVVDLAAAAMALLRRARISSIVLSYPDQNEAGVATNLVRISTLGVTLYLLREGYILDRNGTDVRLRCSKRGPLPFLFNGEKQHTAEVRDEGRHATYFIPLLGADWIGEYTVRNDENHIESTLTCAWAEAREVIDRHASHKVL